jgi:hypothetical protein
MTSRLAQGEIATAPAAGRVDIVLNGFDADQRFNDCRYTPRGATDPSPGDSCLVAFDDQGDAWVIAFDPT